MKSLRTIACSVTKATRLSVLLRDGGRCIICRAMYPLHMAHFIPRSQGGLGIPENLATLCLYCHDYFDNGPDRAGMEQAIREYLMSIYPGWYEAKLYYQKWSCNE